MKRKNRILIWFMMLTKRLLRKWSFLVILALIAVAVPVFSAAVNQSSGIENIALYSAGDSVSAGVTEALMREDSVMHYTLFESEEDAILAVENGKCSAAWIFDADFEKNLEAYINKESIKPFVRVVEQEESITKMLAREKLFGKIYPHISYSMYEKFVREEIAGGASVPDEILRDFYNDEIQSDKLIEIKMIGSGEKLDTSDANYLTTPLRGILALIIMLCGFASALFFMQERADGLYAWLPRHKHVVPSFGSCLGATLISALVSLAALGFAGLCESRVRELSSMAAYVWAATAFCVLLTSIFRRASVFGALIPFFMIVMLALCPIFFSFKILPAVRLLLPPYYYLMSVYSGEYVWYMVLYGAVGYVLAYAAGKAVRFK